MTKRLHAAVNSDEADSDSLMTPVVDNVSQSAHGKRSLANSSINRNGLMDGSIAPDFRLPSLSGDQISLKDFRGQNVLLIFSDPDCGPCNILAPKLERLSRRTPDIQVLMVSRGDYEINRLKAAQYNLNFPIVLQRKWEISRLYAMFATPIAYYINEQGVISGNVAVGTEAILRLLVGAAIHVLLDDSRL